MTVLAAVLDDQVVLGDGVVLEAVLGVDCFPPMHRWCTGGADSERHSPTHLYLL